MATLILTAVGTALGGPIGGALGALVGRAADQMILRPPGREGPRIADLHVQMSSYGSQIPKLFGAMRVAGTVIWATDLRETRTRHGGGKGQPSVTTYSYSASFAVALSARPVTGVGRIWADGNLLRGAAGDFKSGLGAFRLHLGTEDQPVDPLIASAQGAGGTPAHRGIAYAVLEDLALEDFGNRIPSLTFEVFADAGAVPAAAIAGALLGEAVAGSGAAVAGYAASGGSVRDALAPLVEAEGLVLREGEAGFALDGGVSDVVAFPKARLARRVNGRALVPERLSRTPAETVPVRLSLRHYDAARDYQAGVQKAVWSGAGRREASVDLPAVVSAAQARGSAQARLAEGWIGRERLELRCGWDALLAAPGTVLSIEGQPGRWRIEEAEWEGMAVRLSLVRVPGAGALTAPASSGAVVRQPDLPHGPTRLMIVDLPPLGDGPAMAPLVFAAAAGASAGWRRAALFTVDPVTREAVPAGGTAPAATMGTLLTPPDAGTAMLFDDATMVVELLADDMMLLPADDDALMRGANLCLVGGELMQFGNVTEIGPRSFRLGRLLRGRRGTEWAMAGHGAGEPFLLIEEKRLAAVPAGAVRTGQALEMVAIGIGDAEPAEATRMIAGEALVPPSPVHLHAGLDGTGSWLVRWTRRSRSGWSWSDGIDAPLGEEIERYSVRLFAGSALLRSAEVTAPLWVYSATAAAADLAAGHRNVRVEVRQIGMLAMGRAASVAITL